MGTSPSFGLDGGRGTQVVLALAILALTMHPFRDGALFLLQHTPHVGGQERFFHVLHFCFLLLLTSSSLAVCGHHFCPRIAIVFSLPSSLPNFVMSQPILFLISSFSTLRSFLAQFTPSHYVSFALVCVATRAVLCAFYLRHSTTGIPFSSFLVDPGPLHENAVSAFFA